MRNYIAVVPARSGSKGVADKNIQSFQGQPLLVHSLRHGKEATSVKEVFLWTDSTQYMDIAKQHVDIPDIRLRTAFIDDFATDYQFLNDLLQELKFLAIPVDALVLLRPTTPIRAATLIDSCVAKFEEVWDFYDSLRTVCVADKTPFKMWFADQGPQNSLVGRPLSNLLGGIVDSHSLPRQALPLVYTQNGAVDIIKVETIVKKGSSAGDRICLYTMDEDMIDIDSASDIEKWDTK